MIFEFVGQLIFLNFLYLALLRTWVISSFQLWIYLLLCTNKIVTHTSLRFSLNSELHSHKPALLTVIGGEEEHFEDFGESNTSELLLESTVDGTEQPSDSHLLQTPEQVNGSSLLSPRYVLLVSTLVKQSYV